MAKRVIIRVYVSRYQEQKKLGEEYRQLGLPGESFTEYKKRVKEETQNINSNFNLDSDMGGGARKIDPKSKLGKKRHTPSDISSFH